MNKQIITALGFGFIIGVVITWGYFSLVGNEQIIVKKNDATIAKNNEQINVNTPLVSHTSNKQKNVQSQDVFNNNLAAQSDQNIDALSLEEQVLELQQELALQKKVVGSLIKQIGGSSNLENVLQERFDEQQRNEQWAYQVETALQDFLLTSDLVSAPDIVIAECKTTVCKFKLVAPADNDEFDHIQWREFNDKLMNQEFWQQFKRTTSHSNDSELTLLMTTKL